MATTRLATFREIIGIVAIVAARGCSMHSAAIECYRYYRYHSGCGAVFGELHRIEALRSLRLSVLPSATFGRIELSAPVLED